MRQIRRLLPFVLVAGIATLFLFSVFQNGSWRRLPQAIGLGEAYEPSEAEKANALPDLRLSRPQQGPKLSEGTFKEPKVESNSPYPRGKTKPAGSNYTRCLVIPKLQRENTDWVDEEFRDMEQDGLFTKAVYVVDDPSANLTVPKNKGNEVMVYLTYIIDFYDKLADVNIFMHAHRWAFHNNDMLGTDAVQMIRRLSPERVTREGYMNLRCQWDPGCPGWLHPGEIQPNATKGEEWQMADSWAELFPLDPIPTVIGQPCCAQFAVSRERILQIPKQRFVQYRDWILRTELSNYWSGRVFEYTWQFIFTADPIHCPSMSACYCDGFGVCFGNPERFDYWFQLRYEDEKYREEERVWHQQANLIEDLRAKSEDGKLDEEAIIEVPEPGRDKWLSAKIAAIDEEKDTMLAEALERGKDPKQRALESEREWHEGDGF